MADKRRFELLADVVQRAFPHARRAFDVAGGQGRLNEVLTARGYDCTTFDTRHKHLPVKYASRFLTLEEPCACDVIVGLHPDGATRAIIDYAHLHGLPFAIVPCCSDNSMPYKSWMKHLAELATDKGFTVTEDTLPIQGRARVLLGTPPQKAVAEAGSQA